MEDPKSKSTTSTSTAKKIPDSWKWVEGIVDEAHFPHLKMPVKWNTTREKHSRTVYDQQGKILVELDKDKKNIKKTKKVKTNPVKFIKSTSGKAAATEFRLSEPELHKAIVKDEHGNQLVPCLAHGDFVQIGALQADHMHAKENIIKRQQELVDELNKNQQFADFVMSLDGMDKFFIKIKLEGDSSAKYYGTLFFYELYFNDIDNIWLICQVCNLNKSDDEVLDWLKNQWMYGDEFLKYLGNEGLKNDAILKKTKTKSGLGEIAIEWFWKRHGTYVSLAKKLLEEVTIPIKILNKQFDYSVGRCQWEEAERKEAIIKSKINFLSTISQTDKLDLQVEQQAGKKTFYVKTPQNTKVETTPEEYEETAKEVSKELPKTAQKKLTKKLIEKKQQKKQTEKRKAENPPPGQSFGKKSKQQ